MHKRILIYPVEYSLSDDGGKNYLMFLDSAQEILLKMENQSENIQVYLDNFANSFPVRRIKYLSNIGAIFIDFLPNLKLSRVAIYLESLKGLKELDGVISNFVENSATEYIFR